MEPAEGQVLLFMLFTIPENQDNGVGRMMMEWGVNVAHVLMLPTGIEGTPASEPLHTNMG